MPFRTANGKIKNISTGKSLRVKALPVRYTVPGKGAHKTMNGFKKRLPIGMENFEEIRREDFYYVDKTALIRDLLRSGGKVTLFTRPR